MGEGSVTGDKKADHVRLEFSAILVSQLESQRLYFETQMDVITAGAAEREADLEAKLDTALASLSHLDAKLINLAKENKTLTQKLTQASVCA